uniref:Protein tyrosine phosphatase receptor type C n=1 Tax=Nannospalax galili TaxID=1026970 RepID=A0A8C6RW12_NANGA
TTMYLWLRLLAFGFVFLDIEVFVTGQNSISPSNGFASTLPPHLSSQPDLQAPSTRGADTQTLSNQADLTTLTPAAGGHNLSGFSLTVTASSTLNLATDIVTPSTAIATTQPKPSCDEKYGNITVNYSYDEDNKSIKAEVKGDRKPQCETTDCVETFQNLQECLEFSVPVFNDSCTPTKFVKLEVPPSPKKFKLFNCTETEKANTSICLMWKIE